MKKLLSLLTACALCTCVFAACGDKDKDDDAKDTKSSSAKSEKKDKNSIIGTWTLDEESINVLMDGGLDDIEEQGMKLTDASMEFKDDETAKMHVSLDCSEIMCLTDDGFKISGMDIEVIDFDGTNLAVGMDGQTIMTFERTEKSDDKYGEYKIPADMGMPEDYNAKFIFEKSGVSYMDMNVGGTYTYDKESGELKLKSDDEDDFGDPSTVKIDGDKMEITSSEGKTATLTRKK